MRLEIMLNCVGELEKAGELWLRRYNSKLKSYKLVVKNGKFFISYMDGRVECSQPVDTPQYMIDNGVTVERLVSSLGKFMEVCSDRLFKKHMHTGLFSLKFVNLLGIEVHKAKCNKDLCWVNFEVAVADPHKNRFVQVHSWNDMKEEFGLDRDSEL